MAENETTSHCFAANNSGNNNIQFVSAGLEKSNDLLRPRVQELKEEKYKADGSKIVSVKRNACEVGALKSADLQPSKLDIGSSELAEVVADSSDNSVQRESRKDSSLKLVSKRAVCGLQEENYLESNKSKNITDKSNNKNSVSRNTVKKTGKNNHLDGKSNITNDKNNELAEPMPGSSNEPITEESSDGHTVWLPSTTIKSETEDNDSKCSKSEEDEESEDEVGEEERLENGSDDEMDDDSNGGAYHLAEVSYGDENEDSQKAEGQEGESIFGMSLDFSHSFLTLNNEGISFGHQGTVPDCYLSKSESDDAPKKYACKKCDYKTDRKYNLKFHSMTHTKSAYSCSVCRYQTNSRHELINHHKIHKNNNMFVCSQCDYTSMRTAAMKEHFRTHTGEKPYYCSECSFNCSSRNSLLKHKRTHTGETPYGCEICGKRFKQSGHLTEHMRKHTGEKPFKCTICDYSCAYRCRINRHMEMHSDEKPFPCSICPFRAKNRATINLHMRTHLGDDTYKCDDCEYTCKSSSQLKDHAYIHTGETLPFGCALCDARFTRKRVLIKHLRAHEANTLLTCNLCGMKYISKNKLRDHLTHEHKQQS